MQLGRQPSLALCTRRMYSAVEHIVSSIAPARCILIAEQTLCHDRGWAIRGRGAVWAFVPLPYNSVTNSIRWLDSNLFDTLL
jgi:hypothetical protein